MVHLINLLNGFKKDEEFFLCINAVDFLLNYFKNLASFTISCKVTTDQFLYIKLGQISSCRLQQKQEKFRGFATAYFFKRGTYYSNLLLLFNGLLYSINFSKL